MSTPLLDRSRCTRKSAGWNAIAVVAFSCLCGALATGCGGGTQYELRGTALAPGADADITVTPLAGGNFGIVVKVEHLAPPDRLGEGLTHHVVWIAEPNQRPRRLGFLPLQGGRAAELSGTTVARRFDVFVTAERVSDPQVPSNQVVLSQAVRLD